MKKKIIQELKKKQDKADIPMILQRIRDRFTDKELQAISEGGRLVPGQSKVPIISFEGERIKIGYLTDSHLGSIFDMSEWVYQAFEVFKKEKCDFICHTGDVTEGMSNRPGHIHELSHIGYDAQKKNAIEVFSQCDKQMYFIDGNHDRWFIKSNGAKIVQDICEMIPNAEFLGHDEGDISLKGKATLRLWHGEDGNSYATSYRLQKVVESFSGGEKPGMLFAGHTHKQGYFFDRHVHIISGGSIGKQSRWMRSKRLSNHAGFHIVEMRVNKSGISRVKVEWFPFYA